MKNRDSVERVHTLVRRGQLPSSLEERAAFQIPCWWFITSKPETLTFKYLRVCRYKAKKVIIDLIF
jgi:hypothetical protein